MSNNEKNFKNAGISVDHALLTEACDGEPYLLSLKRWKKIANDFSMENGKFDSSKIPEVCDNVKFDLLHNPELTSEARLKLLTVS